MGAVVDVIDGQATGAFFRAPAWHDLGTVFADEVTDYMEMLKLANMLGQNIRFGDLTVDGANVWAADYKAIVRTNPINGQNEVLGIASPDYEIRQVEEIFSWIQFGPTDGMRWETAGQMKGGTQVFGSIAFEREAILDPTGVADVTKMYMLAAGSFDGSLANYLSLTPVRVVCENTLNIGLKGGQQTFKSKSTKNIRERVSLWQKAVTNAHSYMDAFELEAQALYESPLSKQKFFADVIPAVFGDRPDENVKGAATRWDNRQDELAGIWNGQTIEGIRDTAWGAFNTLTEYNQWYVTRRGDNATENKARAGSGFDNAANAFRNKVLNVVKTFA